MQIRGADLDVIININIGLICTYLGLQIAELT